MPPRLPSLALGVAVALACSVAPSRAELRFDLDAAAPPPCRVEPFADASVAQVAADAAHACGGSARIELASPRGDTGDGPGLVTAAVERTDTRRFGPLQASVTLAWSAAGASDARLRTGQAMLGAGGRLELHRTLALRAQFGVDAADGVRNRTRVAGLWRPRERDLLYAEWAGSDAATDHVAVGLRWTLLAGRAALDVGARRTPSGDGWVEPRIGLLLPGIGE